MSFTNYVTLIQSQRSRHPAAAKNHYFNYLPEYNFTAQSVFNNVAPSEGRLKFITITSFDNPLYPDVEDLIYAELLDTSLAPRSTLDKWRYTYIPQSMFNNIVEGSITFAERYFPFMYTYNITKNPLVEVIRPSKPYLFRLNRPSAYSYSRPLPTNTHPYSSNFIFTGVHYVHRTSGHILYEYIDYQQTHDYQGILYYSDIRPKFFNILSNNINEASLVDILNGTQGGVVKIPQYQTWAPEENYKLFFNNKHTNSNYSKKTWFVYYKNDGIISTSIFPNSIIRNSKPVEANYNFVETFLGKAMSLYFKPTFNAQNLAYNQTSTPTVLKIGTNNP